MKWHDILKNVITQGRIKEIEDIDIDIEEDDCLRWLERLFNIIAKDPESGYYDNQIDDEESACKVKAAWEGRLEFISNNPNYSTTLRVRHQDLASRTRVDLAIEKSLRDDNYPDYVLNNMYHIELTATVFRPTFKQNDTVIGYIDEEKAIRIIKELCNYLNISYDKVKEALS